MKEFMFFIRKQENSAESLPPELFEKFLKACEVYIEGLKKEGKLISAQPMEYTGKIISKTERGWKDAPFSEPKEVIAGYYHILANDLDEAVAIAKANPEFKYNPRTRIEVRPVKMKEVRTGYEYPQEISA